MSRKLTEKEKREKCLKASEMLGQPKLWLSQRMKALIPEIKPKIIACMKQQPNPYQQRYNNKAIRDILGFPDEVGEYRDVVRRAMLDLCLEGKIWADKNHDWVWALLPPPSQ